MMVASGTRYGKWTVVAWLGGNRATLRCECGYESDRHIGHAQAGRSTCCIKCRQAWRSHGQCVGRMKTPEYRAWWSMKMRCENANVAAWEHYGGRGITVFGPWSASFDAFLSAVGPRPGPGYSLDRIDNSGGYEPCNVRWATAAQQSRNTSRNVFVTACGKRMCIVDWSSLTGLSWTTIHGRLKRGWIADRAVSDPAGGA